MGNGHSVACSAAALPLALPCQLSQLVLSQATFLAPGRNLFIGSCCPTSCCVIAATGDNLPPIRRESDGEDRGCVPFETQQLAAFVCVPHFCDSVQASDCQPAAVGRESGGADRMFMPRDGEQFFSR